MPDIMSREKRSALMARVRQKNTSLEQQVFRALRARDISFSRQGRDLPGTPDIVFHADRVAVFVDGDFWHGWRFPKWEGKLRPFWRKKIRDNRARDRRNIARLRRWGWTVVRVWGHQVEKGSKDVVELVLQARRRAAARPMGRGPERRGRRRAVGKPS